MTTADVLAHQLVMLDELIDRARGRRAWGEEQELIDVREQIRDLRSRLLRLDLPRREEVHPLV